MLPFSLYYLYFLSPLLTSTHVIRPSSFGITPYEAFPRNLLTPEKQHLLPLYPMTILAGYTSMTYCIAGLLNLQCAHRCTFDKFGLWFSRSGMVPGIWVFNKLPDEPHIEYKGFHIFSCSYAYISLLSCVLPANSDHTIVIFLFKLSTWHIVVTH